MEINKGAILTVAEWDHIQQVLAKHGSKFDWYIVYKIDRETGGRFGKNYTW